MFLTHFIYPNFKFMKTKFRILFALPLALSLFGPAVSSAQTPMARGNSTQKCIDETKVSPDMQCGRVYEPVCGCNGKTYANVCDAQKNGVVTTRPGTCPGSLEETVMQSVKAWEAAYNEGDSRKLEATFAKDAVLLVPGASVNGAMTIGKSYAKTFEEEEGKIIITISDIDPICDEYVVTSGTFQVDGMKKATRDPIANRGSYVNLSQVVDGKLVTVRHEVFIGAAADEKAPAAKAPAGN